MSYFGLETLFAASKSDLKTPADVLVLFLHWSLNKEGYQCVGTGEGGTSGSKSELLPAGWNSTPEVYTLNYKDQKENAMLLKVVKIGASLSINLLKQPDKKMAEVTLEIKTYISDDLTDFDKVFISKEDLRMHVDRLLDNFKEAQKRKESEPSEIIDNDPLRAQPRRPRVEADPPDVDRIGPPRVGGSDLDPLGRMGGGGMLMEDPSRGSGGHPMRPRWDPVGPLDPDFGGGFGGMGGGIGGGPLGGGGMGPLGGGGMGPLGGGGGLFGGGGRGGGMLPRGGGGRRNFGDAMRPPGWDNDNMFM